METLNQQPQSKDIGKNPSMALRIYVQKPFQSQGIETTRLRRTFVSALKINNR